MSNQNITLSLPEEDLREARILAARRGTSVSQLLARLLRELVGQETGYARARDRSLDPVGLLALRPAGAVMAEETAVR
ncbi:MAG TPA: hypothetical protein VFQ37_18180 [Mycobacterium sp.]|nr:hypothetical protein [Mycobacterium sp.]